MTNEEKIAQIAQIENFAAEKNIAIASAAEQFGIKRGRFYALRHEIKMEPVKIIKPLTPVRATRKMHPGNLEKYQKVAALLEAGKLPTPSCKEVGVSLSGFFNWKKKQNKVAKPKLEKVTAPQSAYEFIGQLVKKYPQIEAQDIGELFKMLH
jgi:ACT domain-containing protein